MFALSRLGEEALRISLKCEPRLAEARHQQLPKVERAALGWDGDG